MQRDLFGTAAAAVSIPDAMNAKTSFLDRYRMSIRLDQALFLLIGLLVIYVLVFSFGVETGKRYAMDELRSERAKRERLAEELRGKVIANMESLSVTATTTMHAAPGAKAVPPLASSITTPATKDAAVAAVKAIAPVLAAEIPASETTVPSAGKFTIQILTMASKTAAEKEVKKLNEKGLKSFIIARGKKSEICVEAFDTRQKATQNLKELKTQGMIPADAYVRTIAV